MTMIVRDLGVTVRRLREARGWSQEQLAEHAGLNRSYVGEIERGSVIASIVTVEKLAQALDATIAALLCALPSLDSSRTATAVAVPVSSAKATASPASSTPTSPNVPA
ncbi:MULTISPECIES: helix-turn-helix domain-containing protein [Paraburkholderia]|uniref:helix-turn-helix domain-containing protein n=1 Tax=Paraburkholderia TaxID=1822464 RepID=UPI00225B49AF|nr:MULTISPECIES: helix-turn-helix transcriptional regulator [Paraburkholderia]MCX4163125.1 helix-turn-helix transcriptional regulator [Paraburkholderia megapolitana]MDN7158621.1 helix-turn-helix domain-containing protein [Paraburkholderia sp. CHISQ3]MDQ6495668.1 helix-turn-helix domain-containing protein [Paraburkholderia megapolitana]